VPSDPPGHKGGHDSYSHADYQRCEKVEKHGFPALQPQCHAQKRWHPLAIVVKTKKGVPTSNRDWIDILPGVTQVRRDNDDNGGAQASNDDRTGLSVSVCFQ
jgi:hypothetical protein